MPVLSVIDGDLATLGLVRKCNFPGKSMIFMGFFRLVVWWESAFSRKVIYSGVL